MKTIKLLSILFIILALAACNKNRSKFIYSEWKMNGKQYRSNYYDTSHFYGAAVFVGLDDYDHKQLPWVYLEFKYLDTFPTSGEFRYMPYMYNCISSNCVVFFLSDEVFNYSISPNETYNFIKADEQNGIPRYTLSPTWFWVYKIKIDNMGMRYGDPTGDSVLISGTFYMPYK